MNKNLLEESRTSPWVLVVILIGYLLGGMLLGNLVGILFVIPFFDTANGALLALSDPVYYPEAQVPLLVAQGVTAVFTFIIGPIVFMNLHLNKQVWILTQSDPQLGLPLLIVGILTITFMVAISPLVEWNMNWQFPGFLSEFEEWARNMEDTLAEVTEVLTNFDSFGVFLLGFLVIAILPGIGEELLFRGLFQNIFHRIFNNPHIGIWLSALIFGVIHMQFYGVVPRVLLGVLFGYLYFWSGNLGLAMFAHFVNNGFQLILLYMYNSGAIEFDINSEQLTSPSVWVILMFAIFTGFLLLTFYRRFNQPKYE